jgi:hypothetical protein
MINHLKIHGFSLTGPKAETTQKDGAGEGRPKAAGLDQDSQNHILWFSPSQ